MFGVEATMHGIASDQMTFGSRGPAIPHREQRSLVGGSSQSSMPLGTQECRVISKSRREDISLT